MPRVAQPVTVRFWSKVNKEGPIIRNELCECYAPVLAARYREGDDPMCLYVGQCPDCQRILWTWYER